LIAYIADTHAIIWHLYADPRLPGDIVALIETIEDTGDVIGVSAITIAEMTYLVEKGRIQPDAVTRLAAVLRNPESVFQEISVDLEIAETLHLIPRVQIPDLPDRIIAATALYFGVPLISRDGRIRASSVQTIW
jgi:PIN domain nuclease of toxin-antitoxin system